MDDELASVKPGKGAHQDVLAALAMYRTPSPGPSDHVEGAS